jgi:hypothetical protein
MAGMMSASYCRLNGGTGGDTWCTPCIVVWRLLFRVSEENVAAVGIDHSLIWRRQALSFLVVGG